ncbi:hypothetical protein DIPPA_02685 [Diplonema papillatum]|nr:hypothetical protein DIPPA_02685 [Diplonema papillatum]
MPGTPQRDLSQQHPASSLFTPGAYGMWRNSGAAVPAAVYQNPAHRALPAPADNNNDRFWTDFIEEWDGVSKSIL